VKKDIINKQVVYWEAFGRIVLFKYYRHWFLWAACTQLQLEWIVCQC